MGFIWDLKRFRKKKPSVINSYRFDGLHCRSSGKGYYTMQRVSDDKDKIVLLVNAGQILKTARGYFFYLDYDTVIILEDWQLSKNINGYDIILFKNDFQPCRTFKKNKWFKRSFRTFDFESLLKHAETQGSVQWYDEFDQLN